MSAFIENDAWRISNLHECLSAEVVELVRDELKLEIDNTNDRAWWTVNSNGKFTVSSAYNFLR